MRLLTTRAREEVAHFASNRDVATVVCPMIRSKVWGTLELQAKLFERR